MNIIEVTAVLFIKELLYSILVEDKLVWKCKFNQSGTILNVYPVQIAFASTSGISLCVDMKNTDAPTCYLSLAPRRTLLLRENPHISIYNTPPPLVRLSIPYRASYVHISSASCRPLKTHNPTNIILLALRLRMHALKSILILFFHQPLMR